MNCPKCNKEMKIIFQPAPIIDFDGSETSEVIGRCNDCDYDATWWVCKNRAGFVKEWHLRRFYFG